MSDNVPFIAALFALVVFYGMNKSRRLIRERTRKRMFDRQLTIIRSLRSTATNKTEKL